MPTRSKQTPESVRKILMDRDSFTTTLTTLLVDIYGTEYLTWEPTTILMELQDDYRAVLPQIVFDRIIVGTHLLTSNGFYKSCPTFVEQCNVLAGYTVDGSVMLPDSLACGWGITEALLLAPPEEDDEEPFTDEIRAYIGQVLTNDGIVTPPDILKIAILQDNSEVDFSDDADMFAAVKAVDAAKTAEITYLLRRGLMQLLQQLASLPLNHGDTSAISQKLVTLAERV